MNANNVVIQPGNNRKYFRATEAFGVNSENNADRANSPAQRNTMNLSRGRNSRRRTSLACAEHCMSTQTETRKSGSPRTWRALCAEGVSGHEHEQHETSDGHKQLTAPSPTERQVEQPVLLCNCEAEMEEVSGHGRENMRPEDNLFVTTTLPRKERLAATVLMFLPKSSTGAFLHAVSPEHRRGTDGVRKGTPSCIRTDTVNCGKHHTCSRTTERKRKPTTITMQSYQKISKK